MNRDKSSKRSFNKNKKKTFKVKRLERKYCIWSGKLKKKGQSGRPFGDTNYLTRIFYIFPTEIHYYDMKKYLGTINLKKSWAHSLMGDILQLNDANGAIYFLKDSPEDEQDNLQTLNKILTLMTEGRFFIKLKSLDILENEIKSEPEYIFMPNLELNIFYNLKESFYELNEQLKILNWQLNLDDGTLEIIGENEQEEYNIFVFKNDVKLLNDLKEKLKLIKEKLSTEEEYEDSDT